MSAEQVIWGLVGIVLSILSWLAIREMRRIEALEKHAKDAVTQQQFERKLSEVDQQRMMLHAENSKKLDEIGATTKAIYTHATDLGRMDERLKQLEERRVYMDGWKHEVVDPYLPRAMDDHERRITKLENQK